LQGWRLKASSRANLPTAALLVDLSTASVVGAAAPPCVAFDDAARVFAFWQELAPLPSAAWMFATDRRVPAVLCCSFEFEHLPDVWWHTATPHDPLAIHEEPEGEQQHSSVK
jgi:hypothetical protein